LLVYEYFAAASDDDAVRVHESASRPAPANRPSGPVQRIDGAGVEPTVNLADLEELLTGRDYDAITENPGAVPPWPVRTTRPW